MGTVACGALGAAAGVVSAPWAARLVVAGPDRGRPFGEAWRGATASIRLRMATGAAAAAAGAVAAAGAGWSPDLPAYLLVGLLGAVLAIVDIRTHRLPNRLVLALAVGVAALLGGAGIVDASAGASDLLRALLCGAAGLAALGAISLIAPTGLGLGDAKLFGALSIALGWRAAGAVFWGGAAGFTIGAAVGLALLVTRRVGLRTALPMGPSLVLGALLVGALWPM